MPPEVHDDTAPSPTDSATTTPLTGRKRRASTSGSRGVAHLTPEQLAKKRANDREAQRAIRERTKNQIETLERRIQELTSQQPYQELQHVLRQKQAVEEENKEIKRSLTSVLNILQPLLGERCPGDIIVRPQASTPYTASQSCLRDRVALNDGNALPPRLLSYTEAPSRQSSSLACLQTPQLQAGWQIPTNAPAAGTPSLNNTSTTDYARDRPQDHHPHRQYLSSPWEKPGFGFLLDGRQEESNRQDTGSWRDGPPLPADSHITIASSYKRDMLSHGRHVDGSDKSWPAHSVPVRNIAPTCPLDGLLLDFLAERKQRAAEGASDSKLVGPPYPNVSSLLKPERSIFSHPLSKVFTDILATFPDLSALPEQVAVLYIMFLIMRWQISPTQENYARLPDWVTPRPSQLFTPHPAWIDHLPWPHMRDKMVQTYQNYPFENFFIPYTTTLSLNWQYEPTDTLLSTPDSEELLINPVFERHLRDLNNWSLGPAFAKAFPALKDTTTIKDEAQDKHTTRI